MKEYILEILKEADLSYKNNDIPIGAIIVKDGEIIGRGHNSRVDIPDVTNHAEIIAIRNAEKLLNDWRLNGCDLYVTLEPCDMCLETIKESRISNVYFILENKEKHKYKRTNVSILNVDDKTRVNYKEKLSNFFDKNLNR